MEYIDASMVGSLGAQASASIGLIATTTWIFYGLSYASNIGFSVQVAHKIGAKKFASARAILKQSITTAIMFSLILMFIGIGIHNQLPIWLKGEEAIIKDASLYFLIFSCRLPFLQLRFLSSSMLRCSGNIKTPSILNVLMCFLDILLNFLFIFSEIHFTFFGSDFTFKGLGYGVQGAALGTFFAEIIVTSFLMYHLTRKSNELAFFKENIKNKLKSFIPTISLLRKSCKIGFPIAVENSILSSAQIMTTVIVAPLGMVAIAANSFGVIIESLCYMPGYGVADAATTLVGQSLGAKRIDLTKRFAWMTTFIGMFTMGFCAILLYMLAPFITSIMTPDILVQKATTEAIRIECFAEPMYAASIVIYGIFVGACDTLVPAIMNLLSIWCVRIVLAFLLAPSMGLNGVWLAMCLELIFRGTIFIIRLYKGNWLNAYKK